MKRFVKYMVSVFILMMVLSVSSFAASKASKVYTESTSLNVRKTASTSSSVLKKLKKNTWVTVIKKSGNFYKVEYADGKYGYCYADFLKPKTKEEMYVSVSSGRLNVRQKADKNSKIKDKLENGKKVSILSKSGKFYKVLYSGTKTGYVSSDYLKEQKPAYKAVNLSVVSFKQTDERWKNAKLGSSSDTIGSSGCTTTALAMSQSFRTGKTITPLQMSKTLSYSSTGMLYWPSDYNTEIVTNSNYLSRVYAVLKTGKPVILGAKTSSGKQHWVVVKGFSGSSLKASEFYINDPGSSKRTKLSQFTKDYGTLYKMAWYK